jgi:protoheme IX farnesyltransferase
MSLASDHVTSSSAGAEPSVAEVRDFVTLLKPRVMSLVIFTALVGLVRAPADIHPVLAAVALFAIAIGAGASGALNMWWDADIDAIMTRTRKRPIPAGRVEPGEALAFGAFLSVAAVIVLGLTTNLLAAGLLAFTIFFYVVVYTMWLKRWTVQNIVIGGAAGAFPPMIGWAAVTGHISLESVFLFLIIFFWTPPHFWALALLKSDDYARAGVPMLPVVSGPDETRRQILIYSLVLVPLSVAPWLLGMTGLSYGLASIALGAIFLAMAFRVWREREGDVAKRAAGQMFAFSIVYLFALFAVLLGEALVMKVV